MANYTAKYNLKKPTGSEKVQIGDINGNMDDIDTALSDITDSEAIVSQANTHAAISAGQYVYVRRHSTLNDGLYKANSAISANATLSSSNLTAISGGGFNSLNAAIATLSSKIGSFVFSKRLFDSATSTSRTLSLPSDLRCVIIGITSSTSRCFSSIVITYNSGAAYVMDMYKGSEVTFTTSTNNKLTISSTSTGAYMFMVFAMSQEMLDGISID